MSVNNVNITGNNGSNPIQPNSDQFNFIDPAILDQLSNLDFQRNQLRGDQQLEQILNQAQDQARNTLIDAQLAQRA